jgi:acyl-coenzyme A synthetase/AMP-(fatty) acid ligase
VNEFLSRTPLAAAARVLDRPALVGGPAVWRWREVHAASVVLAARLDDAGAVVNLCQTRLGFLVTWLAALRRGCNQLLPASGGQADLVAMLDASARPQIVVDDAQALLPHWAEHARCLVHAPQADSARAADADLAWSPPWEAPLLCLYTSGSTGVPQPQVKTLGQFARGAQALGVRLDAEVADGMAALRTIVCSVPSQHMFGVETSVMLPLVHGLAVLERRPLLPADVQAACATGSDGVVWIATPLHLRAQVRSGEPLPHCRLVVTSTMPLAPALAQQAEDLLAAPVLEIYGSTETGALAMRRAAPDPRWLPLPGVRLEPQAQGTRVEGDHFPSPQTLADRIELDAAGGFRLLGREGDLLKIAGRRASLAGLNLLLQDLPGLADGVLYLPATGSPTERLVLIHAGDTLDRAATEAWLRERIDPAFLPRAYIRVERMPRSGAGKVARAALDEIYAGWLARRAAR